MIFNPYQPNALDGNIAAQATQLTCATPLLQDNAVVVALVLAFIAADVLAWCPKGVMRDQLRWITNTRNARTFETSVVMYPWLKLVVAVQLFICFGLTLYCSIDNAPGDHLLNLGSADMRLLGHCFGALLGWYILQTTLVNWLCYLFGQNEKRTIINRSHLAIYLLIAPFATLVLAGVLAGLFTTGTALNLLATLFILSQISFISNGFKIFYDGFGSFCLIFAYLCALEIAPLLMLWTTFG